MDKRSSIIQTGEYPSGINPTDIDSFLILSVWYHIINQRRRSVSVIITTTPNIEGRKIQDYRGIVTGEAIMGANIVRDVFASITDVVGGRSGAYESKLNQARRIAIDEMVEKARKQGADAVIGVDIDYEVIRDGMLMVAASGTAVKLG
jgi:uncharacterized protein YbjQ (UPF0145 family)